MFEYTIYIAFVVILWYVQVEYTYFGKIVINYQIY